MAPRRPVLPQHRQRTPKPPLPLVPTPAPHPRFLEGTRLLASLPREERTDSEKGTSVTGGRGGARAGAGRPRVTLVELVAERRFDWRNRRHRRALLESNLDGLEHPEAERLVSLAERYRATHRHTGGSWVAELFGLVVREGRS